MKKQIFGSAIVLASLGLGLSAFAATTTEMMHTEGVKDMKDMKVMTHKTKKPHTVVKTVKTKKMMKDNHKDGEKKDDMGTTTKSN